MKDKKKATKKVAIKDLPAGKKARTAKGGDGIFLKYEFKTVAVTSHD